MPIFLKSGSLKLLEPSGPVQICNGIAFVGPGSVVGIATGNRLDGPGIGARFSTPVQTGPGAHPASCRMGTGSFPGANGGQGLTLTPHSLLVPWSRKSRAIPLLPYGPYGLYRISVSVQAVRPVQNLSACTRVHFTPHPF